MSFIPLKLKQACYKPWSILRGDLNDSFLAARDRPITCYNIGHLKYHEEPGRILVSQVPKVRVKLVRYLRPE